MPKSRSLKKVIIFERFLLKVDETPEMMIRLHQVDGKLDDFNGSNNLQNGKDLIRKLRNPENPATQFFRGVLLKTKNY